MMHSSTQRTEKSSSAHKQHSYHLNGHRERIRQRVLRHGASDLADYELLEMLLFTTIPRRDTKPLAKRLIQRFGSLVGVFQAPVPVLKQAGLNPRSIALLQIPGFAARCLQTEEKQQNPHLGDWQVLRRYLETFLSNKPAPQTWILYLDNRNMLLRNDPILDAKNALPEGHKEIAIRLLELHATAIIVVYHNLAYSTTTLGQKTRALKKALLPLSVEIHDGLVIRGKIFFSLKQAGLLS